MKPIASVSAPSTQAPRSVAGPVVGAGAVQSAAMRAVDLVVATMLLMLLLPVALLIAFAIKLDSRGPVLYRCRRIGRGGAEFAMLKFRKMRADASGPLLTIAHDPRLTRIGHVLARSKLDELPQLWNVLRGQMSLVGSRPESPEFVARHQEDYEAILSVRPGITGLSQLAYAKESEILDQADRVGHYLARVLPQKLRLDRVYAENRSLRMNVRILSWTALALFLRLDVAVNRRSGALGVRRRPRSEPAAVPAPATSGES